MLMAFFVGVACAVKHRSQVTGRGTILYTNKFFIVVQENSTNHAIVAGLPRSFSGRAYSPIRASAASPLPGFLIRVNRTVVFPQGA